MVMVKLQQRQNYKASSTKNKNRNRQTQITNIIKIEFVIGKYSLSQTYIYIQS